jgi:hypothetical protein
MATTAFLFNKAFSNDSTAADFTAKAPRTTAPSGAGVVAIPQLDTRVENLVFLQPYGGNDNNDTFDLRVWGWTKQAGADYWIPVLLLELNCTLGNIAATGLSANAKLCDTLAIAKGDATAKLVSSANDLPAHVVLDAMGCQYIEFDVDLTTGGDYANCLYRWVS